MNNKAHTSYNYKLCQRRDLHKHNCESMTPTRPLSLSVTLSTTPQSSLTRQRQRHALTRPLSFFITHSQVSLCWDSRLTFLCDLLTSLKHSSLLWPSTIALPQPCAAAKVHPQSSLIECISIYHWCNCKLFCVLHIYSVWCWF